MRLATLAWRGLLARPLRSSLAIVGIALGVAVVTATIVVGSSSERALESVARDLLGRADVRLRAFADEGFGPRTVQSLRGLPGVVAAAPVAERRLTVSTQPGADERVFTVTVFGIDPADDALLRLPELTDGLQLSADSPTDALVTASFAAAEGLELGDGLLLTGRRPGAGALRIVGLLADSGFGALDRGEVIVASREVLDASFEVPAPVRYVDLDLGESPTEADIERVTDTLDEPFVVERPGDVAERFAAARDAFVGIAALVALISVVVGAFLVGNTLAMTVGERTRDIGLLRAAGTTSRQVVGIVVRQALALGLLGSVAGIVLGIGLAGLLVGLLSATRAVLTSGLAVSPGAVIAPLLVGLLITLVSSIVPARRAGALSPLDALRPANRTERSLAERLRPLLVGEVALVGIGLLALAVAGSAASIAPVLVAVGLLVGGALATAWLLEPLGRVIGRPFEWLFGAQGMLGRVNLARDRARTGLTVGAMMIALAAVVALGTVAETARTATERGVASILPGGQAIRTSLPLPVDDFRPTFEGIDGVQAASPILEAQVVRVTAAGQEEASMAGIDPNVFADAGALIVTGADRTDAFAALRDGGAVLVPAPLAEREAIDVGDVIVLAIPGGTAAELSVAGIVTYSVPARAPDGAILMSAADARDLFGAASASVWLLLPQPDIPATAFAAAVRDAAIRLAAQPITARELAQEVAGPVERMAGLLDVLALVAVVIGALGIVNTLGVGIGERVREIAILRSHGMTVGQVQAMVVSEAAIMGAIAGVLAIATGLLVAVALLSAGQTGGGASLQLPWALLIAVVLAGAGIAALAGLYPARVAASLPIVGNLKHFE
jgi:putative ABC transport system permease protein